MRFSLTILCFVGPLLALPVRSESTSSITRDTVILPPDDGSVLVTSQCGYCHSLALVTQNRADREGWRSLIRWMQEKHGLWELGTLETPILDYLEKHYSPKESGRRPPIAGHLLPKLDIP